MKKLLFTGLIGLSLLTMLGGCATYYMTADSLKQQLDMVDQKTIHEVYDFRAGVVVGLLRGKQFYNGLDAVLVTDKTGNVIRLRTSPHTAIKITDKNDRHKIVYFDTVFITDSLVYGNKSHFIDLPIKPFKLKDIVKIELQL